MSIWDDTPESAPKIPSALPSKDAAARQLRSRNEYQRARERFLSRAKTHHNPDGTKGEKCGLFGQPIDCRLKFPHPRSWSLDHVIPIKENPALMLNASNWRSSHLDCNTHRQADEPPIDLGTPSEYW
jgi:hypothetical protein